MNLSFFYRKTTLICYFIIKKYFCDKNIIIIKRHEVISHVYITKIKDILMGIKG